LESVTGVRIAVVIPAFGAPELTYALLEDIYPERELVDAVIVDNRGDYSRLGWERVLRPGENLGWSGGCNAGLAHAASEGKKFVVLLNNDTRLSHAFFHGLALAQEETSAGLVAPVFNDVWPQHATDFRGEAADYVPRIRHREVAFVDGTCMALPLPTYRLVGGLDAASFGRFGWGAELDYSLRVRRAGLAVCVTERAYMTHVRQATGRLVCVNYEAVAGGEMDAGMRRKWGGDWWSFVDTTVRPL
jgi:GT2 family glycosyltransferase